MDKTPQDDLNQTKRFDLSKNNQSIYNVYKNAPKALVKNVKKDGVIYTPSKGSSRPNANPKANYSININKKTVKRPQKTSFAVAFSMIVFFTAVAALVAFALVFGSMNKNNNQNSVAKSNSTDLPDDSDEPLAAPIGDNKETNITALVIRNSSDVKKLDLYDLDSRQKVSVFFETGSELKDKYGKSMAFAEFIDGSIVECVFLPSDGGIKSLKISANGFKFDDATGAEIDAVAKTIKINSKTYNYDNYTKSVYKSEDFELPYLDPIDVISVVGYKDFISRIEIIKSHGTIEIEKNDKISDAVAEIDRNKIVSFDENVLEKLEEGNHRLVIKGSNIEPVAIDFFLAKGETYKVDTSEMTFTAGTLKINCEEEGARLTINGIDRKLNEDLKLGFNTYEIKITKEGFVDHLETVEFKDPKQVVNITLEKISTTGQLTFSTDPAGVHVYVNNIYQGTTPLTCDVEYGTLTVAFRLDGYVPIDLPVVVSAEGNAPISLTMQVQQ